MISSTTTLWEDAKAAEADAAPAEDEAPKGPSPFEKEVEAASTPGDEVPEWQNPRHHNNPDKDRVFAEEFGPDEEMPEVPLPPFDDGSGKVMASPELHAIAEEIVHMNMIEVNELCQRIAEHFGIEEQAGPPMMMAGAGGDGAAGEEEAAAEEKTAFDLKLVSFDAKAKIKVIKEVRGMAGLGLKEAKEVSFAVLMLHEVGLMSQLVSMPAYRDVILQMSFLYHLLTNTCDISTKFNACVFIYIRSLWRVHQRPL